MFYVAKRIEPLGDSPWSSVSAERWNRFFTSRMDSHRRLSADNPEDARAYLDHLWVLVHELDKSRVSGGIGPKLAFQWRVDERTYTITCLRGELVMATAVVVHDLLDDDEHPQSWALAARLVLSVSMPQMNMWLTHTPGPHMPALCSKNTCRQLLALCLLRLQIAAINRWESKKQANDLGAKMCLWARNQTTVLGRAYPHIQGMSDEFEGLVWLFTQQRDPAKRQRLVCDAKAKFESLRHWDRVKQAAELEVTSQLPASGTTARELSKNITPVCASASVKALVVPYEPPNKNDLQVLLWEQ